LLVNPFLWNIYALLETFKKLPKNTTTARIYYDTTTLITVWYIDEVVSRLQKVVWDRDLTQIATKECEQIFLEAFGS
jgi:hypothetical protein